MSDEGGTLKGQCYQTPPGQAQHKVALMGFSLGWHFYYAPLCIGSNLFFDFTESHTKFGLILRRKFGLLKNVGTIQEPWRL